MMKPNLRENPLQFLSLTFQLEQPFLGYELGTLPANQKVLDHFRQPICFCQICWRYDLLPS